MDKRKHLSETLRIDLIPDAGGSTGKTETSGRATAKVPHIGVRWPKVASEPTTVARSRYQELLHSVYDAAIVSNVYGRISDANGRAEEFLKYSREELCSLQIFDVIGGADRQLLETLCEALQNQRFILIQAYCKRRDGSFFPAEIAVNMLRFGQIYLCFFIRDITRRKHMEDRLRTEHEALQNAAVGVVIADLDARIEYANPAFLSLVANEDEQELIGRDLRDFCEQDNAVDAMLECALGEPWSWVGELQLRRVGKGGLTVGASATCSRDDEGEPMSLVVTLGAPAERNTVVNGTDDDSATHRLVQLQGRNQELQRQLEEARDRLRSLSEECEKIRAQSSH